MKLIPEEEYYELKRKNKTITRPSSELLSQSITDADERKESLMNSKSVPDDVKLQMLSSMNHSRLRKIQELEDKPVNVKVVSKSDSNAASKLPDIDDKPWLKNDEFILASVPSNYKSNASLLLQYLRRYQRDISWDRYGAVFANYRALRLRGVNMIDLINYCVRTKSNFPNKDGPVGITRFKQILLSLNAPLSLLSPKLRKELSQPYEKIFPSRNTARESYQNAVATTSANAAPASTTAPAKDKLNWTELPSV